MDKRDKDESIVDWLKRVSIKDSKWLEEAKWRQNKKYWIKSSFEISLSVLVFLRENNMEKETLEDLVGFELNLKGSYDWKLSEIRKLELILNKKLL